ncbi:hypothetical protein PSACC_00175 [Paramicrosporidium saccamoebae]|uniref:Uncharacterized protein n=1 Tax=Paramicrosporidium saccamoebae TaxID=1246581 RepID=A0A2H9TQJ0_9FUNG|nr:hypothetical protein PSACC_00175 [Paramicrosporidium saccamoebae]
MKAVFLVFLCALLKLASASRFPRSILRLGEPTARKGSPVQASWNPNYIGLQVHNNCALIRLTAEKLQVYYDGAVVCYMYRREHGNLTRLPEESAPKADDLIVIVLGGTPRMTKPCLEEILGNFSEKSVDGAAGEVVTISLRAE